MALKTYEKWMEGTCLLHESKTLCDAVRKISVPTRDFPKEVTYPEVCGSLCVTDTVATIKRLHGDVLKQLANAFPPLSIDDDPLLFVSVYTNDGGHLVENIEDATRLGTPAKTLFALMLAPLGRSGRFAADQDYLECLVLEGSPAPPFNGLIIKAKKQNMTYDVETSRMLTFFNAHQDVLFIHVLMHFLEYNQIEHATSPEQTNQL